MMTDYLHIVHISGMKIHNVVLSNNIITSSSQNIHKPFEYLPERRAIDNLQ